MRGGINFTIRGVTLLAKFLFLIFLAKIYSEKIIGMYGIAVSTIVLLRFILGFEYYTYTGRIASKLKSRSRLKVVLSDHFSFLLISSFILVLLTLIALLIPISWSNYIPVIFLITIFEIWGNEIYRLLVYLDMQLKASLLMFVRSGLWMFLIISLYIIFGKRYTLEGIFYFWMLFALLSLIWGGVMLYSNFGKIQFQFISCKRFFKKIQKSFHLMLSTISVRAILTVDKYLVTFFAGIEATGVYTFYVGITTSMNSLIDAGVISMHYPKMIKSYFENSEQYVKDRRKFIINLFVMTGILITVYLFSISPVLNFIDKQSYNDSIKIYYLLLIAFGILSGSNIYHYDLYVKSFDSRIGLASMLGGGVFIISGLLLGQIYKLVGVAISLILTFLSIGIFKFIFSKK